MWHMACARTLECPVPLLRRTKRPFCPSRPCAAQLEKSFKRFYKDASPTECTAFVTAVRKSGGQRVTMSQLQEHFVQHRKSTKEEAIRQVRLGEKSDGRDTDTSSFYS